jgi:predicted RNase H-like nuclease
MTWETILKRQGKIPSSLKKAAFRRAIIRAGKEAGPDFTLPEIHEPFLKYFEEELAKDVPRGYWSIVSKFRELNSFLRKAGNFFDVSGVDEIYSGNTRIRTNIYNLKPEDREE